MPARKHSTQGRVCRHNKRKDELFIFDDQTGNAAGTALGTAPSTSQAENKLQHGQEMVTFPGVNAPAPPGADAHRWVSKFPNKDCLLLGVLPACRTVCYNDNKARHRSTHERWESH